MLKMELRGGDRLEGQLLAVEQGAAFAARVGVERALRQTQERAKQYAHGRAAQAVLMELPQQGTTPKGRVYNDVVRYPWSSYLEFGTGIYADEQGTADAIRLKRAKSIPWYIHVDQVPASFAKYGFPIVEGKNGARYYQVRGTHPHPYLHPAAFASREENARMVGAAISALLREVMG